MRILIILEYTFYLLVSLFVSTQIIVPGLLRRPLFPILRHKRRELEAELASNLEQADLQELEKQVRKTRPKTGGVSDSEKHA